MKSVTDPGFPRLEYATCYLQWRIQDFPDGSAPTSESAIILHFFCRKLHQNERIWTPRGGRPWRSPWIRQWFGKEFAENCMKMKEIGLSGVASLVPLGSTGGGSRIFPRGVRPLPKLLLFFNFCRNCMKIKEFGPPGGVPSAPLGSANDLVKNLLRTENERNWTESQWSRP